MKGFRTLVGNGVILLSGILSIYGIDLTPEEQEAVVQFLFYGSVVFNTVMRFFTTTPVMQKR